MSIFAIEHQGIIVHLAEHATDEKAQAWYRATAGELTGRATLVVLDLAAGEVARVGDTVTIDDDGVAQLEVTS